jgi:hypothetical protein
MRGELNLRIFGIGLLMLLLSACVRTAPPSTLAPFPTITDPNAQPTRLITPTWTPLPYAFIDANPVFNGICFASVYDAAGRVFVIRSAADLDALFDESDNSGFCERPSARGTFDFAEVDGIPTRAIIGRWDRGIGCDAHHDITRVERDDVARLLVIYVRFVLEGNCDYQLVRPFWIGLNGFNEYDLRMVEG